MTRRSTAAGLRGVALSEFTRPYKSAFFEDLDSLRIRRADHFPEATAPAHIERMIEMIATLIDRDCAVPRRRWIRVFPHTIVPEIRRACAL